MKAGILLLLMILFFGVTAQDEQSKTTGPEQDQSEEEAEKSSFKDKVLNLGISKKFNRTKNSVAIGFVLQQAKLAESQNNYLTAINHYQKAIDFYVEQGDQQAVTDYLQQIAFLYQKAGRTQQALDKYQQVFTSIRKQYSITGNTVITAARIEKLNKKFKSQLLITKQVFDRLTNPDQLPGEFINEELMGQKQPVALLKVA